MCAKRDTRSRSLLPSVAQKAQKQPGAGSLERRSTDLANRGQIDEEKIFCDRDFRGLRATFAALGSASAADLPMPAPVYKAPPPPPVYNWTGCYIAGGGGYGMWTQDSFVTVGGTPVTASQTNGGKGWFGMGQAGCDYEFTLPLFSGWSPRLCDWRLRRLGRRQNQGARQVFQGRSGRKRTRARGLPVAASATSSLRVS